MTSRDADVFACFLRSKLLSVVTCASKRRWNAPKHLLASNRLNARLLERFKASLLENATDSLEQRRTEHLGLLPRIVPHDSELAEDAVSIGCDGGALEPCRRGPTASARHFNALGRELGQGDGSEVEDDVLLPQFRTKSFFS